MNNELNFNVEGLIAAKERMNVQVKLTKKEIKERNIMIASLVVLVGAGLLLTANPFSIASVAYLAL